LGEVVWTENEDELRERGILVKPTVQAIRTNFQFRYWPDHQSDKDHNCLVPQCKLDGKRKHRHQNNYQKLKASLVSDHDRNELVCDTVWDQVQTGDHHHLIITDEVRHVEAIYKQLLAKYPHIRGLPNLYVVTGKVKQREKLFSEIKEKSASILISTIAKEGLDIPVIDRVYLPFPSGNVKVAQQKIGRGTRVAEGKTDYIVFDFQDVKVDLLKKQFKNRADKLYRKSGMEVIL
jgi:superfamily II DNA or RNA helicase